MKTKQLIKNFVVVLIGSVIISAAATTIQKFTFEEMVELSELILEGEVISVAPFTSEELVYTRVVLGVHDVLKGDDPGEYLELDFLGGEIDGKAIRVSGQDIPFEGEKGFYFIENTSNDSVNPLLGWSQGHFRIVTDAKGNESLETDIRLELLEITDNKNAALATKLRNMKFSNQLVTELSFTPATPTELRDAVDAILIGD
ncbi:MAG: hypothetical protein P8M72_10595 [Gammaproteobacteria bacterium]|nr:hypothetical protein [Gammaproteobacteria bacterium]